VGWDCWYVMLVVLSNHVLDEQLRPIDYQYGPGYKPRTDEP
jgi:hypothetical protein